MVDKGWNLHLKFGKGESQEGEFVQRTTPQEASTKTVDKRMVCGPPREKQTPLEMGTGGEVEAEGVVMIQRSPSRQN